MIGLEQSMLTTQEKMEKERQLEFEFFETEQLMLEELELKQREAAEQMEREIEKLKLEEIKREHTSALRNIEEQRKKLQLDRQRQQEQMVRDKVRLTNLKRSIKSFFFELKGRKYPCAINLKRSIKSFCSINLKTKNKKNLRNSGRKCYGPCRRRHL